MLGSVPSLPYSQQSPCRLQTPPRSFLLTVLLIWPLQTFGDKQFHLCEEHGKIIGMQGASRWVCPYGRVAHGPLRLTTKALAEPSTWAQADGSPAGFGSFVFIPLGLWILLEPACPAGVRMTVPGQG